MGCLIVQYFENQNTVTSTFYLRMLIKNIISMGCQENLERKIELFSMGTTLKFLKVFLNCFLVLLITSQS